MVSCPSTTALGNDATLGYGGTIALFLLNYKSTALKAACFAQLTSYARHQSFI